MLQYLLLDHSTPFFGMAVLYVSLLFLPFSTQRGQTKPHADAYLFLCVCFLDLFLVLLTSKQNQKVLV